MVILKCDVKTLEGVLKNKKYAANNLLNINKGELILLQQTKKTLLPQQKSICWIMNFVEIYLDNDNESDKIWGRHWKYIIRGENLTKIDGFNISEIQTSSADYGSAMVKTSLKPEDEEEVLKRIEDEIIDDDLNNFIIDIDSKGIKDIEEIIALLDEKYKGKPEYKTKISRFIKRPTPLRDAIIERYGTTCKICKKEGFLKKTKNRYCELHHMIELNNEAPSTLQSWNILVLCPNCHKQMHFGNVQSKFLNPGWEIIIDGKKYIIQD